MRSGLRCALLAVLVGLLPACARPVRVAPIEPARHGCRATTVPGVVRWTSPDVAEQRRRLDRWCDAVGPPALRTGPPAAAPVTRLAVVAWNVHVGQGDVLRLVNDLRGGLTGRAPDAIVLLLQEAWRSGAPVPAMPPRGTRVAARIAPPRGLTAPADIRVLAERLGWSLVYVPSMRNGQAPAGQDGEDRGSAILSSLPLGSAHAIELPIERQRRVVVAARVGATTHAHRRWFLDVVSVHLENRPGPGRGWIRAAAARTRQVEALLLALARTDGRSAVEQDVPIVLGGDLNTWRGGREQALRLLGRAFPDGGEADLRPTFGRLRLDYLFGRLPRGVTATQQRLDVRYGSDHHPVVAEIDFGAQ